MALRIPSEDYRLLRDREVVKTTVLLPPQPWLGSYKRGSVLWLLGGFGVSSDMAIDRPACRDAVLEWVQENLSGDLPDTPNAWLHPFADDDRFRQCDDTKWWVSRTRALQEAVGGGQEARALLAERLFVLEAYPYPERRNPRKRLPSMLYTAELLESWLNTGRPVVIARDLAGWKSLVPTLGDAVQTGQAAVARNPQMATISPTNLPDTAFFDRMVECLVAGP